jgi:glutathione S-transferase
MLTLYHSPRSRSSRFVWLLEEIAEPYEIAYVSIRRGDGSGEADPKNPHPDKKVPALVHDGELVAESTAIALYLSDAFPGRIGPGVGEAGRGAFLTWLSFYAAVIEPAIVAKFQDRTDALATADYEAMERRLRAALATGPYLLGERFCAADALIASMFLFAPAIAPKGPEFDAYLARITARPAFQHAQAKDAP